MNLFSGATTKPKTSVKNAKLKAIVAVAVGNKLTRLQHVRDQLKELETEEAELNGEIKSLAVTKYLEMYKKENKRPDNFILQSSDDGGKMMVVIMDKYQILTDDKEVQLAELIGPKKKSELINVDETFIFNKELLNKYQKELSAAIMKIKAIPDEEKPLLIVREEVKTIKKGTIGILHNFKADIATLFNLVKPQVQLKNQNSKD